MRWHRRLPLPLVALFLLAPSLSAQGLLPNGNSTSGATSSDWAQQPDNSEWEVTLYAHGTLQASTMLASQYTDEIRGAIAAMNKGLTGTNFQSNWSCYNYGTLYGNFWLGTYQPVEEFVTKNRNIFI